MKMKGLKLFTSLSVLIVALPVLAKVGTNIQTAYNSSLAKDKIERNQDMDILVNLSAPLSKRNGASFTAIANKNLKNEKKFLLQDPYFGHSYRLNKERGETNLHLGERIYIPVSEESKKNTDLYTRLSVGPSIKSDLSRYVYGLDINYRLYADMFWHQYETSKSGDSNSRYAYSNRLIVNYSFTDKFSLNFDNLYTKNFTYNNHSRDVFLFDQSLSYSVTPAISLNVGHNNSGNALAIDGATNNIKIYNERSSTVYFAVEIVF